MRIAYDRRYNIGFFGLEKKWHPFDTQKFARAWKILGDTTGGRCEALRLSVPREIQDDELEAVHSADYIASLRQSTTVAKIVEVPMLAKFPGWTIDKLLLAPMRRASYGTLLAARAAFEHGLVFNLGGGFHHAKPMRGEGFCVYNDVAVAVALLRRDGLLADVARVAYIDLDVHQGNGVAHCFVDDPRTFLFDMFDPEIYPYGDTLARERIDCPVLLPRGCKGAEYLQMLRERLPGFLDSLCRSGQVGIAFYNAGTDIFTDDQLGDVACSASDVLERDLFVVEQLHTRGIPTVAVTGGGYSEASHQLIAATLVELCRKYGDNQAIDAE